MNTKGRFGKFGGQYVPEIVMPALNELEEAYITYKEDPEMFDRVEKVMGELREAFVAVAAEDTSAPLMANTQKYVAGYTYGRTDVKEMAVNFDISRGFLA